MLCAFDFDGVMCDSTRECLHISLGVHSLIGEKEPSELSDQELLSVLEFKHSDELQSHFHKYRRYVRWPREYYFILINQGKELGQADFDEYNDQDNIEAKQFEVKFFKLRHELRSRLYDKWIDLFDSHDEVLESIKNISGKNTFCILTGRDADSAASFLGKHGIHVAKNLIYDALQYKDKEKGLEAIIQDFKVNAEEVILLDDNISHLLKLKSHGIVPLWAKWGYICPEHLKHADQVISCEKNNWSQKMESYL